MLSSIARSLYAINRSAERTLQERDEVKRTYMMTAMKLTMTNFFIKKKSAPSAGCPLA